MTNWEYRITSLAAAEFTSTAQATGAATGQLNAYGSQGWEAVGMTTLDNNECAVLLKRPAAHIRSSGGRV
ncbi:MAG: hypothetical protein ACI88C_000132 [Acidimicrobiales bacterium]|jgi:hypothetical protein|tara:strand:- start:210 stop:419 length:210 start_codon:yes stop_codon:yes gene_type:complete